MNKKQLGLIIITNESFHYGFAEEIIKKLKDLKIKKGIIKLLPKVNESVLIRHYRNHLIKWNKAEGKSVCPSLGWPAVRQRFSRPLVVILLEGLDERLSEEILNLKGSTDPLKCSEKQIRVSGFNLTYNLIHSSDCYEDVLHESILYFSESELESFYNGKIGDEYDNLLGLISQLNTIQMKKVSSSLDINEKIDSMLSLKYKLDNLLSETKKEPNERKEVFRKMLQTSSPESVSNWLKNEAILWDELDRDIFLSEMIIGELFG